MRERPKFCCVVCLHSQLSSPSISISRHFTIRIGIGKVCQVPGCINVRKPFGLDAIPPIVRIMFSPDLVPVLSLISHLHFIFLRSQMRPPLDLNKYRLLPSLEFSKPFSSTNCCRFTDEKDYLVTTSFNSDSVFTSGNLQAPLMFAVGYIW